MTKIFPGKYIGELISLHPPHSLEMPASLYELGGGGGGGGVHPQMNLRN